MKRLFTLLLFCFSLFAMLSLDGSVGAQINPTPIVITIPAGSATPLPETTATVSAATETPTPGPTAAADPAEPNNSPETATSLSLGQNLTGLTLSEADRDYFQLYLKAGQIGEFRTSVTGGLDTKATAYWGEAAIAAADDRSGDDVGTTLTFTAVAEGWYVIQIERATPITSGTYDLAVSAVAATSTPTPFPTSTLPPSSTPPPTLTPAVLPDVAEPNNSPETAKGITPGRQGSFSLGVGDADFFTFIAKTNNSYRCETVTNQVDTLLTVAAASGVVAANDDRSPTRLDSTVHWQALSEQVLLVQVTARGGSTGAYDLLCQMVAPPGPVSPVRTLAPTAAATAALTETAVLTPARGLPLTLRPLGQLPPAEPERIPLRLVVYYDLNNDRAPSPGEGIPNVSVLAVSAGGQRVVQIFTNAEGEALFTATPDMARLVVPFVSAWSVRINHTAAAESMNLALGLPAVRIPLFLPLTTTESGE